MARLTRLLIPNAVERQGHHATQLSNALQGDVIIPWMGSRAVNLKNSFGRTEPDNRVLDERDFAPESPYTDDRTTPQGFGNTCYTNLAWRVSQEWSSLNPGRVASQSKPLSAKGVRRANYWPSLFSSCQSSTSEPLSANGALRADWPSLFSGCQGSTYKEVLESGSV